MQMILTQNDLIAHAVQYDLIARVVSNHKMFPVHRLLYIALIEAYPQVLTGERIEIELWIIQEKAGWISTRSAENFFQGMQAIDVWKYERGNYNKEKGSRPRYIQANTELISCPEHFYSQKGS